MSKVAVRGGSVLKAARGEECCSFSLAGSTFSVLQDSMSARVSGVNWSDSL